MVVASARDVRAQDAPPSTIDVSAQLDTSEELETPELRTLRLAELEMFGPGAAPLVPSESALRVGVPAPVVTSTIPPAVVRLPVDDPHVEFLDGLTLPDFPVQWDAKVLRYLRFYRDDPRGQNIIRAWLTREARYGDMVRGKLRELGLPEDLVYVAMVESGFDPTARSGAGAVGMWQFVQPTGEEYGLTVDHWTDERMDPEAATVAGARYLGDLYRRFGSWELAFAAYNMGYGALLRAMRKYNTNDYWTLARVEAGLPFETTFYVAKIMACAVVGRNPERFGAADIDLEPREAAVAVEVPGGTTLAQVARASSTPLDELVVLNPSLRRRRVPPGPAGRVRVPLAKREVFARQWTRASPRRPAHRNYLLRFGESLGDVAHRFRTTESELRALNELDADQPVGPGFRLLVPAVEPRDEPAPEPARPVVTVPAEPFGQDDRRRVFFPVSEEQRLSAVARFFGVSADDLVRWNNVDPDTVLAEGLVLQLFVPTTFDLDRAVILHEDQVRVLIMGTEEFFDHQEAQQGRVRFRYMVRTGDTLSAIARRFDLSVGSLCRINHFGRSKELRAGEEIIVYTPREHAPAEARREFDDRVQAHATTAGEPAHELQRPALADDGDGEEEAGDSAVTAADEATRPGGVGG
jgi:membrane-bound lytic murein transglycosylase D